jgi:type II secretory ATPase GspE/PulE/Tfp pilus assembly ATPase PilB-like protein
MRTLYEGPSYEVDRSSARLLPVEYCLDRGVVLLGSVPGDPAAALTVGLLKAGDSALVQEVSAKLGHPVVPVEINGSDLRRAIGRLYDLPLGEEEGGLITLDVDRGVPSVPGSSPNELLEFILFKAVARRATDLHLEVYPRGVDLRFRIDGVLHAVDVPISFTQLGRLVSRMKVLCSLDLAERRRAQDGRFSALYTENSAVRRIDFRVSVLPGPHGQDVAIRVLDPRRFILDLGGLSMPAGLTESYRRLAHHPHGLLLATGPTGAGKTTTLYATLNELQAGDLKIVSVEDPIEYEFSRVNQKNVTAQMGFADHLRAFLRSNPDVIHVGEIRDAETAEMAIRAGTTGHLVLSTLHTRDAISSVARLRALGVSNDFLSEVLIGVLGQRLVRRLCDACKKEAPAPSLLASSYYKTAPGRAFFEAAGCGECDGTGYRGLVGVYELLEPDEALTEAIGSGVPVEELRRIALASGWTPLVEDALAKAEAGVTSLAEIARRIPPPRRSGA